MNARRNGPPGIGWLRRLSEVPISAKLCIAPALILCIFLGLAGFSYHDLLDSQRRVRDLTEGNFETFRLVSAVDELTAGFHTSLLRSLSLAATESDHARVAPRVAAAKRAEERMLATFD